MKKDSRQASYRDGSELGMVKNLKAAMVKMLPQAIMNSFVTNKIETLGKEIEVIKKNQMEI